MLMMMGTVGQRCVAAAPPPLLTVTTPCPERKIAEVWSKPEGYY